MASLLVESTVGMISTGQRLSIFRGSRRLRDSPDGTPATHLVELQAMFSLQVLQAFPDCTATDAQYCPQLLTGVESPVLK